MAREVPLVLDAILIYFIFSVKMVTVKELTTRRLPDHPLSINICAQSSLVRKIDVDIGLLEFRHGYGFEFIERNDLNVFRGIRYGNTISKAPECIHLEIDHVNIRDGTLLF